MGSNLATHQVLRSKVLKPWLQPFSPPAPKLQRHCHSCWCAWLVGRVYSLNMVDLGEWLRQDKTGVIKIGELKKVRKPDWLRASHWDGPTWLAIFGSCNVKKREKGGVCWCFFDIHLDVYPIFTATISHNIPYIHLAEATPKVRCWGAGKQMPHPRRRRHTYFPGQPSRFRGWHRRAALDVSKSASLSCYFWIWSEYYIYILYILYYIYMKHQLKENLWW